MIRSKHIFLISWMLIIFLSAYAEATQEYTVRFVGIESQETLNLLLNASETVSLEDHPPKTSAALLRRAELDVPNLVKVMHSKAHYDAKIETTVDTSVEPHQVVFTILPGPVYLLGGFTVVPEELGVTSSELGICLQQPAYPKAILEAEERLLEVLTHMSYPLAKIQEREVVADQEKKQVFVTLQVETGPRARFGETVITGDCTVKEAFIRKKIYWEKGDFFSPAKIACTLNALEAAMVFSSINITYADATDSEGYLPMEIHVSEGKQRSIGFGIGYSTQRGPGFTTEWEHRNFRGMGEKLRFNANILQQVQEGTISYLIPDFRCRGQDLLLATEVEHNDTEGFQTTTFSLSGTIEKQLTPTTRISYGAAFEHLRSKEEEKSGKKKVNTNNLIKFPMQWRWSTVDDPLDPSCGKNLLIKFAPSFQLWTKQFAYFTSTVTASFYKPLDCNERFVLAGKANFGSIFGAPFEKIPAPELFYAGTENMLRGYTYYTVSPLSKDHDPLGGRSLMVYSLEARWRATENWGAVLFYDVGNVYHASFPEIDKKMLNSVGVGLRYFTPVGPLRLDFAVPLNRRRHVDRPFQVYFSVGQSF